MKKIVFSILFFACSLYAESLKIAIDPTYPPFEYKNTNGQIVGFDVELIAAIAQKAEFDYKLIDTAHDSVCSEINKKTVDIAISALTHDKFTQNCDYSNSYYNPRFIFLKLSGSEINSTDDLNGKKIGYIGNDIAKDMIEAFGAKPIRRDRSALINLFMAMQDGKADALLIDSRSLPILTNDYEYISQADKEKLETYERMNYGKSLEIFYQEDVGNTETIILFPNDGSKNDLKDRINKAIAELKSDGTIDNLIKKYHL